MKYQMKNKATLFTGLSLAVTLGLVLPLHQAQAIVPLVGAAIAAVVVYVGGWVMQALSLATAGLVAMNAAILQWVINLDWPYTTGGIVAVGWPIVRDLANIFFVVVLVVIGLTIALRLEGFGGKKSLFPLVVIILLINFTPVIAGLIIDASNILMNFFVEGIDPGAYFSAHLAAQHSIMPASIWEALNPFKNIDQLLGSLAIISMDLMVFFIFGVFAFLFLVRFIAIWILVILSPIAFASYILPATRGAWKMWWNQFIQWCIIGVTAGFFLYLGTQLLSKLDEIVPPSPQGATGPADIIINLMPLFTVVIFFVIGLFVSLATSAMGAKQITTAFKKGGQAAGKVLFAGTAGLAWNKTGAVARKMSSSYRAARRGTIGGAPLPWYRAAGVAVRRGLPAAGPRVRRGLPADVARGLRRRAVFNGAWNIIKGTAIAGATATLGIKTKKKGFRKGGCPVCKLLEVAAGAERCPRCGHVF